MQKNDKKIIGIDLETIISIDKLVGDYKSKEELEYYGELFDLIKKNGDNIYLFVPTLKTKSLNKKLNTILKLYANIGVIPELKMIHYQDDFYGAVREYRPDILIMPEEKVTLDVPSANDDTTIALAIRNHNRRLSKKHWPEEHTLEEGCQGYIASDFLPDYLQIIAVGRNTYSYSDSDQISFANDLSQAMINLPLVKNKQSQWRENIFKSYEYVPKTGIATIDEEWKPYWISSKFENNIYEKKLQQMTRLEFIEHHNRFQLDRVAIKYINEVFEVEYTWREVITLTKQCCRAFLEMGLQKGDTATICMPNTIEDYVIGLALNHIGVIVNPIHPLSTKEKIERYLKAVHPKIFIGTDMPKKPEETMIDLESLMLEYHVEKSLLVSLVELAPTPIRVGYTLKNKVEHIKKKENYRDNMRYKMPADDKKMSFKELLQLGKKYKGSIDTLHSPDDTAYYYSTGGTTSDQPKIVDVPFSMLNTVYYNSYGIEVEKGDAVLINYPRYIAFSDNNCTHLPASAGMKMVFTPYEYPENCAEIFEKEKISVMQVAPQWYEMMLEDEAKGSFDGIDLSSIKYLVAGGDKWDNDLKERVRTMLERHGNTAAKFIVGYGNTELYGSAMVQLFETYNTSDDSSIGIPLPPFKLKLVDEDRKMVINKTQRGRLYIGGKNVCMKGYLGDEKATKEVLVEQDMYDTADIIEFGKAPNSDTPNVVGRFITREKRFVMITQADRSGKVIPDDIEREITSRVNEVQGCCVVGIKDEDNVMRLKAAVVLHNDTLGTEKLREKIIMASQQKDIINTVAEVKFIDELPLTDRQKVNYRQVEEMFTLPKENSLIKKK